MDTTNTITGPLHQILTTSTTTMAASAKRRGGRSPATTRSIHLPILLTLLLLVSVQLVQGGNLRVSWRERNNRKQVFHDYLKTRAQTIPAVFWQSLQSAEEGEISYSAPIQVEMPRSALLSLSSSQETSPAIKNKQRKISHKISPIYFSLDEQEASQDDQQAPDEEEDEVMCEFHGTSTYLLHRLRGWDFSWNITNPKAAEGAAQKGGASVSMEPSSTRRDNVYRLQLELPSLQASLLVQLTGTATCPDPDAYAAAVKEEKEVMSDMDDDEVRQEAIASLAPKKAATKSVYLDNTTYGFVSIDHAIVVTTMTIDAPLMGALTSSDNVLLMDLAVEFEDHVLSVETSKVQFPKLAERVPTAAIDEAAKEFVTSLFTDHLQSVIQDHFAGQQAHKEQQPSYSSSSNPHQRQLYPTRT